MRFALIDRIVELTPGERIVAIKTLTLSEEYLWDHFPNFPVMPGVLMLQAMTEAASWLIRVTDDFAQSIIVLREAANIKFAQFVEPGQELRISAEIANHGPDETTVKAKGSVEGRTIVSAKLALKHYNLADRSPDHAQVDLSLRAELIRHYRNISRTVQARQPQAEAG